MVAIDIIKLKFSEGGPVGIVKLLLYLNRRGASAGVITRKSNKTH